MKEKKRMKETDSNKTKNNFIKLFENRMYNLKTDFETFTPINYRECSIILSE